MPFGIQPIHLIVIAIVALLIFGPSRLPEIGRSVGKAMTEFRHSFREMNDSLMEEVNKPTSARAAPEPLVENSTSPVSTAMNICPQCGTLNPREARFCNSCGAKLAEHE